MRIAHNYNLRYYVEK